MPITVYYSSIATSDLSRKLAHFREACTSGCVPKDFVDVAVFGVFVRSTKSFYVAHCKPTHFPTVICGFVTATTADINLLQKMILHLYWNWENFLCNIFCWALFGEQSYLCGKIIVCQSVNPWFLLYKSSACFTLILKCAPNLRSFLFITPYIWSDII